MALNWDDLRFFLAVRRAGSLGAAARLLKVEPSTASRRIGSLESALGAQLAARTPDGLALNEAGQMTADLAETIDRGIEELIARIGGEDKRPEGVVRVATTESMAVFLMRGLIPLRAAYPKIQVELVIGSAAHDLARREADVAIRAFREKNPNLVTRKLGEIGWAVFASREYAARHELREGDDVVISDHPVVGYKDPVTRAPGPAWLTQQQNPEKVVLTGDSVSAVLSAVRAGLGLSTLPCFVVDEHPSLVRVSGVIAKGEIFCVIPPEHRETVRVRLVIDALVALFERERALLDGTLSAATK